jgi:tagatose-1,6-bisphosphate aldolase non-catalytic subunit AgaZ/GatZ
MSSNRIAVWVRGACTQFAPPILGFSEAAIQQAVEDNTIFLLESTSGQVNQEGGDTGQTPEEFAKSIRSAAP